MIIIAVKWIHWDDAFKHLEEFLEHKMHSVNVSYYNTIHFKYRNTILNCVSMRVILAQVSHFIAEKIKA